MHGLLRHVVPDWRSVIVLAGSFKWVGLYMMAVEDRQEHVSKQTRGLLVLTLRSICWLLWTSDRLVAAFVDLPDKFILHNVTSRLCFALPW